MKILTLVASFLSAAGCASSPASLPVVVMTGAGSLPVYESAVPDKFVKAVFHGIPGVWIEGEAYNDMLVGFVLEKGDLRTELAAAQSLQRLAEEEAARVRADAKGLQWRATWGPVLAFLGGVVLTAGLVLGAVYAGKALAPQADAVRQTSYELHLHAW